MMLSKKSLTFQFLIIAFFVSILSCNKKASLPNTGYIPIDKNHKLHYRIYGNGNDTIVVPDIAWAYPFIEANGRDLTYIVYDVRDRGYSDSIEAPELISMDYEISDLEKVRQFFNLGKMNLMGWSYLGGMVALYAADYPANVKSIIQIGPINLRKEPYWDLFIQDRISRRDSMLDKKIEKLISDEVDKNNPELFCKEFWKTETVALLADPSSVNQIMENAPCDCENEWPQNLGVGYILEKMGEWDWTEKVKKIKARTLILHGLYDNIPIESSKEWAALNPNARLLIFPASGHMPMAEEPVAFFKAIEEFTMGKDPEKVVKMNK